MLGEPYPSDGISHMLEEVEKLEPQVFREKYVLATEFVTRMHMTIVTEYMKQTIPALLLNLRSQPEKEKVTELVKNAETELQNLSRLVLDDEALAGLSTEEAAHQRDLCVRHLRWFHKELRERYNRQRYCFVGLTASGEKNFYDLMERPDQVRCITVSECGNQACRAKPEKLLKCATCNKAAYCNRECQKLDWRAHHKRFCQGLVEADPDARQVVEVPDEQEEGEEDGMTRVINAMAGQ